MGLTPARATRLISKWGISAQIMVPGPLRQDAGGGALRPELTNYPCTLFEADRQVIETSVAGARRGVNEQLFLCSIDGLTITPTSNDFVNVRGVIFSIEGVETMRIKGDVAFFILTVKRYDP